MKTLSPFALPVARAIDKSNGMKISVVGDDAEAVRIAVNQLFNYGIVSGVPEEYNEERDTQVLLNTYPARFRFGMRTLAEVLYGDEILANLNKSAVTHTVRRGKAEWQEMIAEEI